MLTKIREYAKAIAALLGAVATFLITVNAPPQWAVYVGSVVAILTGVATFGVRNGPKPPGTPAEPEPEPTPIDVIATDAIGQVIANATNAAAAADRVRQSATDAFGNLVSTVPIVGGQLAQEVEAIGNSLPRLG